jgi:trehalose 6-phosphate synthase
MPRALRFVVALICGLAALTWMGSLLVQDTTQRWFEKDLVLRGQLAVNGARQALLGYWRDGTTEGIAEVLTEITHDERIMGAAACDDDLWLIASTAEYPKGFSCEELGKNLGASGAPWSPWHAISTLPGGKVHVSALPILDGERPLGFVALVHDLSWMERRGATARSFLLVAFFVLALAASVVTLVAARLSWRSWTREIRRLLRGDTQRPEFQPVLRDVRELVEQLTAEKDLDRGGAWTPQRLKQTLSRHLQGERVIIVANREPYIHERKEDGTIAVLHPASGLVTALEPVMRACSGVWVAHGSGTADKETADRQGRVRVPPGEESYLVRRVWLSGEEEKGYYYGFSNEGLWPLCHIAHTRPLFRSEDWNHYRAVNQKFADAVCAEVISEDPIILVQDYHFALLPKLLREKLPRATIITFWHIPWPNSEQFGICPWRDEILEGLLGSSILGFHTQFHCNNFMDAVDRFMEARIDREQSSVVHHGRHTLVRPYPISIDWPNRWLKSIPSPAECRASVLGELGLPPDGRIGVGVDRLDYTKGIVERFSAVERLLERFPSYRGKFTFIQLAAPSRTVIERYREVNETLEGMAERINKRFGQGSYRPLVLRRAHHEPPTVFRHYRAADVCYVSSLHDGMNLVAKEFVAARDDERGALVLSHFTGAARELTEALIVNPYDLEAASSALAVALSMPPAEQQDRMRAMRTYLAEFNVYRWAGRMLVDASRLRRRDRLTGRLGTRSEDMEGAA